MTEHDAQRRPGDAKTRARRSEKRSGGGSAKARRTAARLAAVQALYQIELTGTQSETVLGEFIKFRLGHEVDGERYVAGDPQLFADIVRGTGARQATVDEILSGALDPAFPIGRLELLLRTILRAGTYELLAHTDVHGRIVIKEYVDRHRAREKPYKWLMTAAMRKLIIHIHSLLNNPDLALAS